MSGVKGITSESDEERRRLGGRGVFMFFKGGIRGVFFGIAYCFRTRLLSE